MSWIFLFIGIIAAVAMRLVGFFMEISPFHAKIFWYVGVIFFIIFFVYRYKVSMKRMGIIKTRDLAVKVKEDGLREEDREEISRILCGLTSRKEMINFAVIFILSGITLAVVLFMDIMKLSR